jgi:hypothetical protein
MIMYTLMLTQPIILSIQDPLATTPNAIDYRTAIKRKSVTEFIAFWETFIQN